MMEQTKKLPENVSDQPDIAPTIQKPLSATAQSVRPDRPNDSRRIQSGQPSRRPQNLGELLAYMQAAHIPPDQYKRYIDSFLERKARDNRIPLKGVFELTPLCNLDCKMCYVHFQTDAKDLGQLVPLSEWKRIMKEAHAQGMIRAVLTGGECLTYPGFKELYLYLTDMGVEVTILTNGVLLEGEILDLFMKRNPKSIQVSMYGSSEDAYEKVTGARVFERVRRNIQKVKERCLRISVSITPNVFMRGDVENLIRIAHEMKVPYTINAKLMPPRKETGRTLEDLSLNEYIKIYQYNKALCGAGTRGQEIEPEEIPYVEEELRGILCGAGRSTFCMRWDGRMYPCSGISDLSEKIIDHDFLSTWRKINKGADEYLIPRECPFCAYRKKCLQCVAMHAAGEKGHCNPHICERTKGLIAAGLL